MSNMNRRQFFTTVAGATAVMTLPMPLTLASSKPLIKLSSNENPLGMSPLAKEAAAKALNTSHRYGDALVSKLSGEIAQLENLMESNVAIGNGATGILEAIIRQSLVSGSTLVQPEITYGDASWFATTAGMPQRLVPVDKQFNIDLDALEEETLKVKGPVLVYLVNPNNPTGLLLPYDKIASWVKRAPDNVFFLMDEAYHELVRDKDYQSCTRLIHEGHDNLVVIRTFSKIYAMAGMRLGYALGSEPVIKQLKRHYSDWSISVPAIQAGRASLQDGGFKKASFDNNEQALEVTVNGLESLGLNYIPSQGNFLIHQIKMPLQAYQKHMLASGIKVGRDMKLGYGWNRLSIGTPDEMQQFLRVLTMLSNAGWS